jgi:hypothetical protein
MSEDKHKEFSKEQRELRLQMNKLVTIFSLPPDVVDLDDSLPEVEDSYLLEELEDGDNDCGNTEPQWAYPEDYYDQFEEISRPGDYDHSEEAS